MKLSTFAFLLFTSLSAFASPEYEWATSLARHTTGYHVAMECAPFAREFSAGLTAARIENCKVHFRQDYHGQTLWHVGVFYHASDGWWYQDNQRGPVLVDSFSRYGWEERLENALRGQGVLGAATAKDLLMGRGDDGAGGEISEIRISEFGVRNRGKR
jgi:hypothetical protein